MTQYSLKNKKYLMISIALILVLWQVIAIIIDNRLLLPSFFDVLIQLINIIKAGTFINLIGSSIIRCLQSFIICILVASILAVASYFNKFIYNFLYPVMAFIKAVPIMAFIVLILIWTSKDIAPVIIGILISLPIYFDVVLNSLLNIDKDLLRMCKVYKVSKLDKIKSIVIPIILIELGKVISSSLSLIFKVVISGEVYGQPDYGIGSIIQLEKMQLNTSNVIAWMIVVTFIVYGFDFIIERIIIS